MERSPNAPGLVAPLKKLSICCQPVNKWVCVCLSSRLPRGEQGLLAVFLVFFPSVQSRAKNLTRLLLC